MHHLKIKIPGKIPPIPAGRLTQREENFITSTALNECADKRYRKYIDPIGGLTTLGLIDGLSIEFNLTKVILH